MKQNKCLQTVIGTTEKKAWKVGGIKLVLMKL